ncbi:MAG: signal peptidase II [Spirochaetales bacterium]|jgi:signal peptidase II|nr:signal peptidase II [Exilispira sp.]NMC67246.1 signal peptidase II [Spirochaetales bacterium]
MKNELIRRLILVLLIIFLTIFIDQISKYLVSHNMDLYSFKSIIPGVLNFRYITNYGFLLGIGSNLNDGRTFNGVVIITIFALFILLGYFIYLFFQKTTSNFLLVTFSILIGGAWGNFLDRLIKGKVVDFLEFVLPIKRIGRFYIGSTPIFNMADFFVTVGIIMLLIYYFIIEPKEHNRKKAEEIASERSQNEFSSNNDISQNMTEERLDLDKNENLNEDINENSNEINKTDCK